MTECSVLNVSGWMKPLGSLAAGPDPISDTVARRQCQCNGGAFASRSRFISEAV
jgi:hypothetical protein